MKIRVKYFFSFDIYKLKLIISTMVIRAVLETKDDIPYLSIYLFTIRVYKKRYILKRKNAKINVLQIVNTDSEKIEVRYGFDNPTTTGLVFGALSALKNIEQYPDFLPEHDYIVVNGSNIVYLWTTIMNYFKYKRKVNE